MHDVHDGALTSLMNALGIEVVEVVEVVAVGPIGALVVPLPRCRSGVVGSTRIRRRSHGGDLKT